MSDDLLHDPETKIIYHSEEKVPEELSHIPVELDEDMLVPFHERT